jgi:O-antigen ligase
VGLATLIGGGLLIVVGLQMLPESLTRADEIISIRGTVEGRYVVWSEAWAAYLEHPFFGVGIGSYVSNSHYLGEIGDYNVTDPHNILLRLLVELGPPGLLCFLAIWALIGWRGYRNNQRLRAPPLLALNAGLIAALASYVGAAMFGPAFQRGHGTLFFFFAAILYLLPRLDSEATQVMKGGLNDD